VRPDGTPALSPKARPASGARNSSADSWSLLRAEVERGAVVAERCLFVFPHPSGANGHRAAQYDAHRQVMTAQVGEWAAHREE
jgi:hypothetical protein